MTLQRQIQRVRELQGELVRESNAHLQRGGSLRDAEHQHRVARLGDLEAQERELSERQHALAQPPPTTPVGRQLRAILKRSLDVSEPEGLRRVEIRRLDVDTPRHRSPRWPSGLQAVQHLSGGFYGFTAIGGPRKAGKTMVAMRSALSAAEDGWAVTYCAGENTDGNLEELVHGYLGSLRAFEHPDWLLERFRLLRFGRRASLRQLVDSVADRTWADTDRVLIVLDSVNTLARAAATKGADYLQQLGDISSFARSATEESGGRIGVLALSEENHRGGFAGQQIEYAAACLLAVQPRKKAPDKLAVTLTSRESPGGFCGVHLRVREECRLKRELELVKEEAEEQQRTATTGDLPF